MDAGSNRVRDWTEIAKAYNDSAAGYGTLSGSYAKQIEANAAMQKQLTADISSYYTNAMAPLMPSYDLMKTMQQDHWNSDKREIIASQGGGSSV
jgi:hypothetical protein